MDESVAGAEAGPRLRSRAATVAGRHVEEELEGIGGDGRLEMDDDAGREVLSGGCVAAGQESSERVGMEIRDDGGRRKRKERERESGGGFADNGAAKEDRKKRRDERERRKGRDGGDGSLRREHRESRERKESRRKERKERREERDGKGRKHRDVNEEDHERPEERERDGMTNRTVVENLEAEITEHEGIVVEDEGGPTPAIPQDESLVGHFVETDDVKPSAAAEFLPKSDELDDSKEEGEILDDESGGPLRGPESEVESGEIQTLDNPALAGDAPVAVQDFSRLMERRWWRSPPADTPDSPLEHSMQDRNGKSSNKDSIEKVSHGAPQNPLQSVLVIAEAYESESPASEERIGLPIAGRAESRRQYAKENGSRRSELSELDRRSSVEKIRARQQEVMGPSEQRSHERKDRKTLDLDELNRPKLEDKKTRASSRYESRARNDSDASDGKEQPGSDRPKSLVTRYSCSPERADRSQVDGSRGKENRLGRSPLPMEASRDEDGRGGRSGSKERRTERGRSGSAESRERRDRIRRRSRSPALGRSARRARSPSLESVRDRRISRLESERRRRSRSRESGAERRQSRDRAEPHDRRRRSRSLEGGAERRQSRDRAEPHDRRRRSRSRESARLRAVLRGDSVDRRRRSRSRDSLRDRSHNVGRRADSMDRRRRSRSRSRSIRERRNEDRLSNRHADDFGRRRRSRSRESLRERRADDMDVGRHGRRGTDMHRSGREDRSAQDGRQKSGGRDNFRRTDRDRDQGKDSQDKSGREVSPSDVVRDEENQEKYQERVASQLAAQEEDDVDRIKEESRRRRQAILEKYKKQQEKTEDQRPIYPEKGGIVNGIVPQERDTSSPSVPTSAPSDVALDLEKPPTQNGAVILPADEKGRGLGAGTPQSERSSDMFCDDIFGESPAGGRRLGKGDGMTMDTSGLIDNWDDAEGYYCFRIGEVLDGRYEVASSHGRGVFSTVVRARDMKAGRGEPEEVAIKIIRNNETMYKAGQQELVILKKLAGADPENKRHCVRLLSSFEYRSHLCLVFESLHMNLREILKKFGRNIGINLNAVRAYATQLFTSLKHLRNCGVLHCDIKPDNMLVNESKKVLKVCDFGSAMFAGENEITPYLVSRFYRAPEIILGLPYDHALDIWSVGCCLYELYTGKMLFPGHTNNDMLRLHMELKGSFPKKMLKKAAFADQHFDQDFNFCAIEEDPVTKKAIKRILVNIKPRDMGILVSATGNMDEDAKMLASFKDLLEKIFILDPDKRLTVSQALGHSFISGK